MPTAASLLNQKAQFQRRSSGAFSSNGDWQWGRIEFERPKTITVAGQAMEGRSARLTVRTSALSSGVVPGDRVEVDGHVYSVLMRQTLAHSTQDVSFELESAPTPALYAADMDRDGATVEVVRALGRPEEARVTVRARVWGFAPDEIVTAIDQGKRHVLALASDFAGWPAPPRKNDRVFVRGQETAIQSVDADTHRVGNDLHAYLITVLGPQGA